MSSLQQIQKRLEEFVIIYFKEYYYPDGVGQDITVLYPLNVDPTIEETALLMDYLHEAYHVLIEFHISDGEGIEIYQRN